MATLTKEFKSKIATDGKVKLCHKGQIDGEKWYDFSIEGTVNKAKTRRAIKDFIEDATVGIRGPHNFQSGAITWVTVRIKATSKSSIARQDVLGHTTELADIALAEHTLIDTIKKLKSLGVSTYRIQKILKETV